MSHAGSALAQGAATQPGRVHVQVTAPARLPARAIEGCRFVRQSALY
jgi:ribosomal protein L16/L10AE